MSFVRKAANTTPIEDTVFAVVKQAKLDISKNGPSNVINATIGSLYNEESFIVAYDSVFKHYDSISKETKASYAQSFTGNETYRKAVLSWVKQNATVNLNSSVIATVGGSGAVSITMLNTLDANETVILPNIAWGSYNLMAAQYSLKTDYYNLLKNDEFDIESFKEVCLRTMDKQDKLLIVINDPCHNPTGYSMSQNQWKEVISFINECSKKVPCIILNDIAYIDYAYNQNTNHLYMEEFNNISNNVMIIQAFSCSKTLTSYGLRCGAAVIFAQEKEAVREVEIVFEKAARSIWSNIPNAAMDNFTWATSDGLELFTKEKDYYIDLLKKRSSLFIKEAHECNLPIYKYVEGFFITINVDNKTRDLLHEKLIENHIYTVKVNHGIRLAICSLSVEKTKGLAYKIKQILDSIK